MKTLRFNTETGFEFVETVTIVSTEITEAKHSEVREIVKWYGKGTSMFIKDMDPKHIENVLAYLFPMRPTAIYKTMPVGAWVQILMKEMQYRNALEIIQQCQEHISNTKHRLANY